MKNHHKQPEEIRIAIVSSSYRPEITDSLDRHCLQTLKEQGLTEDQIRLIKVPGSLEIPLVARVLAKQNIYDAIICFGAIYKGKTYHFEQVANECVRGCLNVSWEFNVPVIFEVLSVYDPQDAIDRATGTQDNRGVEGATTALRMIALLQEIT